MKLHTVSCNVGYPLYGARFLEDDTLLIAGGGGEGKNGIPNKLTLLGVGKDRDTPSKPGKTGKKNQVEEVILGRSSDDENFTIGRLSEYEFDPQDDSPTALDCKDGAILVGCNENSETIKQGKGNHHLRRLELLQTEEGYKFKFIRGIDYDKSRDPNDYTKLIHISRVGSLAAIASSCSPSTLRIINYKTMEEKYEIESTDEIKDLNFSPDGKVISYITSKSLELISTVTGSSFARKVDFDRNWNLSKIRFIDNHTLVIGASLIKGNGILLLKIDVKSGKATLSKAKMLSKQFRGITAMDVNGPGNLAALATNDNSLLLVRLNRIRVKKILGQIHSFAITKVTISGDCKLVATVSAANTVHVIEIPENFASSLSAPEFLYQLFTKSMIVLIVAICIQYAYQYEIYTKMMHGVQILRRSGNFSYLFSNGNHIHENPLDYFEQKTLIGDHVRSVTVDEEQQYWEYHEEYPQQQSESEQVVYSDYEHVGSDGEHQSYIQELKEENLGESINDEEYKNEPTEQPEQSVQTEIRESQEVQQEEQTQRIVETSEYVEQEQKREDGQGFNEDHEQIVEPLSRVEQQSQGVNEQDHQSETGGSGLHNSDEQENAQEYPEENQEQEQDQDQEPGSSASEDQFEGQNEDRPGDDQREDQQQPEEQDIQSNSDNSQEQDQGQEYYEEKQEEPGANPESEHEYVEHMEHDSQNSQNGEEQPHDSVELPEEESS